MAGSDIVGPASFENCCVNSAMFSRCSLRSRLSCDSSSSIPPPLLSLSLSSSLPNRDLRPSADNGLAVFCSSSPTRSEFPLDLVDLPADIAVAAAKSELFHLLIFHNLRQKSLPTRDSCQCYPPC